jgi:branched-chain amino acid transport system permease protein
MTLLKNNLTVLGSIFLMWILNFFFQNYLNSYYYKVLVDVEIAIILAVSLNLINGITGQFSLGHAGFMGIGAYVSSSLMVFFVVPHAGATGTLAHLGVGIAIFIGGLSAAVAGLVIGIPTLRLRGDYLAIATLGFGEIIRILILNMDSVGGPRGMTGIPTLSNFFWVGAWMVVCITIVLRLVYSTKGKAFFAIREDEFAALTLGIDTTRYKVIAFCVGSFFAGTAGGLFAHSATGYINPGQFDTIKSIEIVVMVVLGGLGSTTGAIIAAIVLTIMPEALRGFSEYRMVSYSLLLIIVMLTRPQGLFGMKEFNFSRFFKKSSTNLT